MSKRIYYSIVERQIPRLLGQLDRNKHSATFGCFDRNYWHYKITDFACARYQEAALTLALLYRLRRKDNPYFNKESILRLINASLKFWCSIQNKDGSYNEWYPNEGSFVATSFSSYAVSEALILLNKHVEVADFALESLKRSGNCILKHDEWDATNQMSGAIAALYNIFLLTSEKRYLNACKNKLSMLIERQNAEGWWNEYNGADIGYLSLTVDYLSKLYKKYPSKNLKDSLNKAIKFLSFFVHPNMTFGGEYGSRNTEYIIPHGIELNADENRYAASIASAIRSSLKKFITVAPYSVDDRYLCYMMYDWLQAYIDAKNNLKELPNSYNKNFNKNFSNASIKIVSNKNFYAIINYSKGGAFEIFAKNEGCAIYDSGMLVLNEKNDYLTSSWIAANKIKQNRNFIKIEGNFWKVKDNMMTPFKNVGLKIIAGTIGKSQKMSHFLKSALRKKLILGAKKMSDIFIRELAFNDKSIKIVDKVLFKKNIKGVFIGEKYSSIFIPSSRYFQLQELNNMPLEFKEVNKNTFKVERYFLYNGKVKTIAE